MSTVALIPARGGSKGIKRKNLRDLGGISLVGRCIRSAMNSGGFDDVVVSTDDDEIASEALRHGATIWSRPEEFARDQSTTEDAVDNWLDGFASRSAALPDKFFILQCTCPFTDPSDLSRAITALESTQSVFAAYLSHRFLWVEESGGGWAPVGHSKAIRLPRQSTGRRAIEAGNFYGIWTSAYQDERTRFAGRTEAVLIDEDRAFDIDSLEDLEIAQRLSVRLDRSNEKGVRAVAFDFDGVLTDNRVIVGGGEERVACNRSDGHWLGLMRNAEVPLIIVTGEKSGPAFERAAKLGIEIESSSNKADAVTRWMARNSLDPATVAFVGNDIIDIPAFDVVGWPIAVSDSHPDVLAAARIVLPVSGGSGVVAAITRFLECSL
jgi:YrbI family 3-deoxy-D-manno-octulosonate 8-phosphate phosphatase